MTRLTNLQRSCFRKAVRQLKKKNWYRGVCLDSLKSWPDHRIKREGRSACVNALYHDTAYWDAW